MLALDFDFLLAFYGELVLLGHREAGQIVEDALQKAFLQPLPSPHSQLPQDLAEFQIDFPAMADATFPHILKKLPDSLLDNFVVFDAVVDFFGQFLGDCFADEIVL